MRLIFLLLMSCLVFSSCSSYINKVHKQIDKSERRKRGYKKRDPFAQYRSSKGRRKKYSTYSTRDRKSIRPRVRRKYTKAKQRHTVNDLTDSGNAGSLWSSKGQDNFLFSRNKNKKIGDLVVIRVLSGLKKDISNELKRAFPKRKRKKKKGKDDKKAAKEEAAPAEAAAASSNDPDKVYDQVSAVIVEELSGNHILLRGKKDVLFRKRRRLIEVQAMISKKDIADDDSVISSNILESNVVVLR